MLLKVALEELPRDLLDPLLRLLQTRVRHQRIETEWLKTTLLNNPEVLI